VIERIASLDDPRVAAYAHVGDPAWLRDQHLFVAEGRLVVRRLVEAGTFHVRSVLVTPAALPGLEDVLDSFPAYLCEQQTMNAIAGFNFHRGCLALGDRPPRNDALSGLARAHRLLALEGIGNPDNVGGLFRAAAAFGINGVVLDRACGDPLYRKAIRTSMGAVLRVPFAELDDWVADLRGLRDGGAEVVALTPDLSATPLADYTARFARERRLVLMLGAEGPGLSPAAFASASATVRIPIAADVDSLNVVVAAGIALAALAR
jgi:tRNA G18 (ribose-2'-O)-methylase SpoU